MKLAIIDKIGLCYDGDTLSKQGLGGSESAVILISKELSKIGFEVTVYNNCKDGSNSKPGLYDGVRYVDNSDAKFDETDYEAVIVSRTVVPFISNDWPFIHKAKKRILWLHDTFIEGDNLLEDLVVSGKIDHVFTLSDWHTSYILTCQHGKKRNHEVLKKSIFQTRNGAVCHIPEVDLSKKDPNQFVYNASATKGMLPLVEHIWPEIKKRIPEAKLSIIGGYYRFRDGAEPDAQENTVSQLAAREDLKNLGITFTGVIPQHEIAEILAKSWMMLYPGAFPETFGISSLESLLYKTPLVTTRFGALEETAIDLACYHIDYAIEPNVLFPHIDKKIQVQKFLETFFAAYNNPYLHQQKQNYCDIVKDVTGWNTVALQWKQFLYSILGNFLSVDDYRKVTRINQKVARVFGRTGNMPANKQYSSSEDQKRIVVISPFWNAENYIRKNILSIATQDYNNYVHILIDDNSDDKSFQVAKETINSLPEKLQSKFRLIQNLENIGAIANQIAGISHCTMDDIVMLLDGDDWLINNNTLFHYYNDLYAQGYEFTYGSMWSLTDNIPLIAQEYPIDVKKNKKYRTHQFNWKIPYTHLRTCLSKHFFSLDIEKFKVDGKWMKSGHDNPLFYELIEKIEPEKIYCNREIVCNYNDLNPLNDYKINGVEQNRNANMSYSKKFSVIVPTMWRSKPLFNKSLERLVQQDLVGEIIVINNDVIHTPDWIVLQNPKIKMLNQEANIKVNPAWNLGAKESSYDIICIINDDLSFDPMLFNKISNHINDKIGVYGFIVGGHKYNQPELTDGSIDLIEWSQDKSAYGFGQLIIMNKNDWVPIPEGLDVYFGDDFILHNTINSGKSVYLISNINYEEDFGATSRDLDIWKESHDKEKPIFEKWLKGDKHKMNKKILIAIPTNKYIEVETFKSIWDLEIPTGYEVEFQYFFGYQVDQIRNLIGEWAKRYDYLLSIDSDIIIPKDALKKMIAADKDIVTGMYIQRIPDTHTLEIYMVDPTGGIINIPHNLIKIHNGLVEIAACGFGCCLVKSDVFRKMEYPHFYYQSAINHKDTVSEDIYFCKKARDNGFKVWVDTTITCDHKGSTFFKVKSEVKPIEIPKQVEVKKDETGVTVIPDSYRKERIFK
jgi:glycosyltransferase involved in cell wall biosynthesis